MQKIKRMFEWLIYSSENASKWSVTVKSFLVGIVPAILYFSSLANVQVDSASLQILINAVGDAIVYIGGAISTIGFIYGLARKIITTITGENDVVAGWHNEGS